MSEEVKETNDGTWSGLKKTIIATLTTIITAGGAYTVTNLFGGHGDETKTKEVPTEQSVVAPVQATPATQSVAPITINVQQNQENTQQQKQAPATIIRERVIEKQVEKKSEPKKEVEEAPW